MSKKRSASPSASCNNSGEASELRTCTANVAGRLGGFLAGLAMSAAELARLWEAVRLLREVIESLAESVQELSDVVKRIELL